MVKITGYISESGNEKLEAYAETHSKKKMLLIGEIILKYLQEENFEQENETSSKKISKKPVKK